jgi:hypothetical protein
MAGTDKGCMIICNERAQQKRILPEKLSGMLAYPATASPEGMRFFPTLQQRPEYIGKTGTSL